MPKSPGSILGRFHITFAFQEARTVPLYVCTSVRPYEERRNQRPSIMAKAVRRMSRYEKRAVNYKAMLTLAAILLWLQVRTHDPDNRANTFRPLPIMLPNTRIRR